MFSLRNIILFLKYLNYLHHAIAGTKWSHSWASNDIPAHRDPVLQACGWQSW